MGRTVEMGARTMRGTIGIVMVLAAWLGVWGPAWAGPGNEGASANRAERERVAREASALLTEKCIGCHGADRKKGKLDLTRRSSALSGGESGEAIVAGRPDESLLVDKISEGEMPPSGSLSAEQVALLRSWVELGAAYPAEPLRPRRAGADWWSLQPVQHVAPPSLSAEGAAWARTPIDAFIFTRLEAAGLRPAPEADRVTLIRRVMFDLIGLPPTPEEVAAFVADASPTAYENLVDRLLASPRHGERWGRHWLDVVRFGESHGYETNMPRFNAWPYRDYVVSAFNHDLPFPRFVYDQLAGDVPNAAAGAAPAGWLSQAATGFLVGGAHDIVTNQTPAGMAQQRADDLDDIITATSTAFLGLTVQCARCHDHKFDPIRQADYYALKAVFAGTNHAERDVPAPDAQRRLAERSRTMAELARVEQRLDQFEPPANPHGDAPARAMVNARRNVERFAPVRARMVRMTVLATSNGIEPCIDEFEVFTQAKANGPAPRNMALATAGGHASASSEYPPNPKHKIIHLNDGRYGNDRSWISRVNGKGTITVEWPEPATIDRVVWGRDRDGAYGDRLPTHYYIETALDPDHWNVVASSLDRAPYRADAKPSKPAVASSEAPRAQKRELDELRARQSALRERLERLGPTVRAYAGTFSTPGPTHLLSRGDPMRPGALVAPASLSKVRPRIALKADAPEHERRAALARWIGDPANPLPARVMVNRVWQHHFGRGIVATPSDFGFNGTPPSHPKLLDWLASAYVRGGWRLKPLHRMIVLSAAYRQSSRPGPKALAVDRDNRMLGHMTMRRLEAELIHDAVLSASGRLNTRMGGPGYNIWEKNKNYVAIYRPRADLGPDDFRRMVYQFRPRSQPGPTFGAFDCPNGARIAPRRHESTTALQALNLLNARFMIVQSAFFAERLKHEAGPDPARQAERGFRLAFGRAPTTREREAAEQLIASHGAPAFCRALFNANEFLYVP